MKPIIKTIPVENVQGIPCLWDAGQVGRYLGICKRSVFRWVSAGQIPQTAVVRLGPLTIRFKPSEIQRLGK